MVELVIWACKVTWVGLVINGIAFGSFARGVFSDFGFSHMLIRVLTLGLVPRDGELKVGGGLDLPGVDGDGFLLGILDDDIWGKLLIFVFVFVSSWLHSPGVGNDPGLGIDGVLVLDGLDIDGGVLDCKVSKTNKLGTTLCLLNLVVLSSGCLVGVASVPDLAGPDSKPLSILLGNLDLLLASSFFYFSFIFSNLSFFSNSMAAANISCSVYISRTWLRSS